MSHPVHNSYTFIYHRLWHTCVNTMAYQRARQLPRGISADDARLLGKGPRCLRNGSYVREYRPTMHCVLRETLCECRHIIQFRQELCVEWRKKYLRGLHNKKSRIWVNLYALQYIFHQSSRKHGAACTFHPWDLFLFCTIMLERRYFIMKRFDKKKS